MPRIPTVSIAIPAYNEAANIGYLLSDLLSQRQVGFKIKEIIIASDGSTDDTVSILRRIPHKRIRVINGKKRLGRSLRQNQLFQIATGDALVLLDADIRIPDQLMLTKLVSQIFSGRCDLVSGRAVEFPPQNFFEKILYVSLQYKTLVFENYQKGHNVYTCRGPVRAFSKRLYSQIVFPGFVGEDMFSYLYCIKHGYRYRYWPQAQAFYKLPASISDHQKQSLRFFHSFSLLRSHFSREFIAQQTSWPIWELFYYGLTTFFHHPLLASLYLLLTFLMIAKSKIEPLPRSDKWSQVKSSKFLLGLI